MEIADKWA